MEKALAEVLADEKTDRETVQRRLLDSRAYFYTSHESLIELLITHRLERHIPTAIDLDLVRWSDFEAIERMKTLWKNQVAIKLVRWVARRHREASRPTLPRHISVEASQTKSELGGSIEDDM